MNLSTGNMNVIEVRDTLERLRAQLNAEALPSSGPKITALNCALKALDKLIMEAAIKTVVF